MKVCVKMLYMMHDCPKCGFNQPIDRYCASCGLDIDNYVPERVSWFQRLRKNLAAQVGLATFFLLLLVAVIYLNQRQRIQDHLAGAPEALVASSARNAVSSEVPQDELSEATVSSEGDPDEVAALAAGDSNEDQKDQKIANSEQKPKELVLHFAEASKSFLQQLASEGQILDETAQTRSFLSSSINAVESLSEKDSAFRLLPGKDQKTLRSNVPILLDFTHLSSEEHEDVGLNIRITPVQVSLTSVDILFEGMVNLKSEAGSTIASQEVSGNYSFNPKSTLILVGFLPRQAVRAEDLDDFSNTPLGIFESAQFMNGTTDFVIFIQAK